MAPWGDTRPAQRQWPSSVSEDSTRPPPIGHVRNTSWRRQSEGNQNRCPSQLSCLLPGNWAPHLISKGAPRRPAKKTHFGRLYSDLMTKCEVWNVDRLVNRELCLPTRPPLRNNSPIQRHITADAAPIRVSILRSIRPALVNKTRACSQVEEALKNYLILL